MGKEPLLGLKLSFRTRLLFAIWMNSILPGTGRQMIDQMAFTYSKFGPEAGPTRSHIFKAMIVIAENGSSFRGTAVLAFSRLESQKFER